MSTDDFRGAAYLFKKWMDASRDEIKAGKKAGARVIHATADRQKVTIVQKVIKMLDWRKTA